MNDKNRRLLLSFAHPDDESFGIGGTIARYVNEGVDVYLICATNGEAGSISPEFMEGHDTIAARRLAELDCATETLEMKETFLLDYRDSGMQGSPDNDHPESLWAADLDEVAARVTEIIRQVRPHVVITFDPFGGYGHPDHIKIQQATVKAFEAAPHPDQYPTPELEPCQPQKLYFSTFNRRMLRLIVKFMPLFGTDPTKMGKNQDINLEEIARHESPIHTRIDISAYETLAEKARLCHASQLGGIGGPRRISDRVSRAIFGTHDTYTRAYPPVSKKGVIEVDLFDNVEPD